MSEMPCNKSYFDTATAVNGTNETDTNGYIYLSEESEAADYLLTVNIVISSLFRSLYPHCGEKDICYM